MKVVPLVTVVICTRNRAFILSDCLNSLLEQTIPSSFFKVIVVDNASTDKTPTLAKAYIDKFSNFRYIQESKIGLSRARNRGCLEVNSEWIIYLDDDAKASSNFVERAQWIIKHHNFDLFGGTYYAWFKYGRPRWIPETYGTKEKLLNVVGAIEEGFVSGGIMAVRKNVIIKLGGFIPELGMGNTLGYGEEDELQIRLRENGYRIGFDPEWYIDHCVLPDKLRLRWHFKSAYAKGRDSAIFLIQDSVSSIILSLIRSTLGIFWKTPGALILWIRDKDYYWQNVLLRLFLPVVRQLGKLAGRLFQIKKSKPVLGVGK